MNQLQSLDVTNSFSSEASEESTKFEIRKLTWDDFQGQPDDEDPALAHTKWKIGYNYQIEREEDRFSIDVEVWCKIDPASWVKTRFVELLNHQQGHFYIGMICALEFKKAVIEHAFTDDYKVEIQTIFNDMLVKHLEIERIYDVETLNMLNTAKQRQWDMNLIKQLNELAKYA